MRKAYLTLMFILGLTSLGSAAVFSENFEGTTPFRNDTTTGYGYFPFSGGLPAVIPGTQFSLLTGSIDINFGADYGALCSAPAGGKCVDTTGGGAGGRGTIETTNSISIGPGDYYLLFSLVRWSDSLAGPQDTRIQVQFGSLLNQTITVNSSYTDGTVQIAFTVPSSTSAKLNFADLGLPASTGFAGAILDNIAIVAQSEVPEPATYAAVGLGLAALSTLKRKR